MEKKEKREYPRSFDLLTSTDKLLALMYSELVKKKALSIEEEITRDLISLQSEIGTLKGLEHRIKERDRIIDKIISDSADYDGEFSDAASNIRDIIRFTFVIPDELYVKKIDECLHRLEELGYVVVEIKNSWKREDYKDINVRLRALNGVDVFEIQFHTPISYRVKEGDDESSKENSTRILYNVYRDTECNPFLRAKIKQLRIFLQTMVPAPTGALEYEFKSRRKEVAL